MERPILMSGPDVRAILDGRKTQTRRVIRPEWYRCLDLDDEDDAATALSQCPFGVAGDTLWVREGFAFVTPAGLPAVVHYRATAPEYVLSVPRTGHYRWRPGIHMPRHGSRLTLEVVSVRVERVQAISEDDARAEGVMYEVPGYGPVTDAAVNCDGGFHGAGSYRQGFAVLWDDINGKRSGCGWDADPWCWVVEFRRR